MRWSLIGALVLGLLLPARESRAAAEMFHGVTLFAGEQYHDDTLWHVSEDYDWQEFQLRPVAGWHRSERWDLWIEGLMATVRFDGFPNSLQLGVSVMSSYDILKHKGWSLFGELGAGVGWMSETPDTGLVGDSVLGFLDYGIGVKLRTKQGFIFKIGPRFHHCSSLVAVDTGMNSYGVAVSFAR